MLAKNMGILFHMVYSIIISFAEVTLWSCKTKKETNERLGVEIES